MRCRRTVLPYNFVMAAKERECGMITKDHSNPSGVVSLLRTTPQGPSFFAGVFLFMGKGGGRPSRVLTPPPLGMWGGRWVGQSKSWERQLPPLPPQCAQCSGVQVTEYSSPEELALEALCSHPQQPGGGEGTTPSKSARRSGRISGGLPDQQPEDGSASEGSTEPGAWSEESNSAGDDRLMVEGLWDQLELQELPEQQAVGGTDSWKSGGSTDHEVYDSILDSNRVVEVATTRRVARVAREWPRGRSRQCLKHRTPPGECN